MQLGNFVVDIRSKNAGPFWVTIDVFCGDEARFEQVSEKLSSEFVAAIYKQPENKLKRFALPELHVLKFSFPRPVIQGDRYDRDMHGAQYSVLLSETEL